MRILALNGSHRGEAGCTQWLLDKLAEGAVAAGAEFETVVLAKQKITPCSGCETCHTSQHYLRCIYEEEDDIKAIFEKMKTADLLIYATPVYIFTISGLMKTFLDRFNSTAGSKGLRLTKSGLFFGSIDEAIYSKPFVVLTCCGNVEPETVRNIISYFKTFSKFLDAPIVGTLVRKSVGMLEFDKEEPQQRKPVVNEVVAAYIQAGKELATQGRIRTGTEKKANRHILGVPFLDFLMRFRLFKKMAIKRAKN
ncbi:nadph-dependent fmn reductase [Lucifera butyrica]|uniref:Nadph-dependent fmn reductase n=1 Tax=Lucifera butyrica TaxID=1351585 RepID=A0A498RB36_9FIRM|nr:flavodoxin family protein [Lucifera butyrica]VBB08439.1 nadph-dependent fmn reductase [Lucifera butyrica]